jgi:hypothetical protein
MFTPSPEIVELLTTFAVAMTAPTFAKLLVLIYGTILAPGRRTVTAALRAQGLEDEANFGKYHRVFNQAPWSGWVLSHLLLGLIIDGFVPAGWPLILLIDETLERRQGKKIEYKGWFRDAVRSTANRVTGCWGIRWCCLCILVGVPWSERPWALPFLLVPVRSQKTCERLGKPHRSCVEWAAVLVTKVRRWYPEREIVLVGDGAYAAVSLVQHCQGLEPAVKLTARLRLDAALYDFPGPQPKSKRGPKPKKGARQPNLAHRLADPGTVWRRVTIPWYGGAQKVLEIVTGVSLWYTPGWDPVPIRWVLVRCPEGSLKPAAYFCSDATVTAEQILAWIVGRWNIEVTFEEIRAHLGFETQRHWAPRAIERTTPCLFGLFSLVVLMAHVLHPDTLPLPQVSWYPKDEATFSDALAAVRRHLWSAGNYTMSPTHPDMGLIPHALWERLLQAVCYST